MLTAAQLQTIKTELQNDPKSLGYSQYVAETDWTDLANILNWPRDGATPCSSNGVVGNGGAVAGATNATPVVVTTSAPHGLATGDNATISGVLGNLAANGTFLVTVLSSTTFSIQANGVSATGNVAGTGAYTSGGAWVYCVTNFANESLPNTGLISQAVASAFSLLNAMVPADLAAAAPDAAICAWLNALFTAAPQNIMLLTATGAENNVIGMLFKFVGGRTTPSGIALIALKYRFGSRAEQLLNLANVAALPLQPADVRAAWVGSYN